MLRVDSSGAIYYVDPSPPRPAPVTDTTIGPQRIVRGIEWARLFKLHSKPGAKNKVYLNFLGYRVTGTQWNVGRDSVYDCLPYSEDADRTTINTSEANTIAEIWRTMAEDLAPYDIDVTTERPPFFSPKIGHVLFTPIKDANGRPIVSGNPGGIAYLGVFGQSDYHTKYQPAFVFPEGVAGAKNMLEAASHEFGHNLGLTHDGTSKVGYYQGHGTGKVSWAPIMGVGYYAAVSQWSKGEYAGANNKQNDTSVIAGRLGRRGDDHGNTAGTARALVVVKGKISSTTPVSSTWNPTTGSNRGIIGTAADVDWFRVDIKKSGTMSITAYPAWVDTFKTTNRSENLDIQIEIRRRTSTGATTLVKRADALTDTMASASVSVTPGRYYVVVSGVGRGNPKTTGYTDYGSQGYYYLRGQVPY